jgi:hypothetical protein
MRGRTAILKVHTKGKPLDKGVDVEGVARQSPGFSGADLANLVNEAAILSARRNKKVIGMSEFQEALERIVAGPERKSRIISDAEKAIIAYHEGGHAVVQRVLPKCDPVAKVTIISRGMALGYTMALPTEDRYLQSKSEFEDKIAGLLGGTASERLIFGDTTTGASNDIEKATDLARRMVTEFGMSDKLGPLAFGKRDELVFLGREIGEQRNYSDEVAKQIDEEVRAIIDRAYERAQEVLTTHRDKLVALAERLVAEETVDSEEFEKMFSDLPPKEDLHGTPSIVGPGQPVPSRRPSRPDPAPTLYPTRAGRPAARSSDSMRGYHPRMTLTDTSFEQHLDATRDERIEELQGVPPDRPTSRPSPRIGTDCRATPRRGTGDTALERAGAVHCRTHSQTDGRRPIPRCTRDGAPAPAPRANRSYVYGAPTTERPSPSIPLDLMDVAARS